MSKQAKVHLVSARVNEDLYTKAQEYAEFAEVSVGYVIRQALQEYIWAHPLKSEPQVTKKGK